MRIKYESIPNRDTGSVICRDFVMKEFDCPYHMHPEIEILRIDKSEGRMLAGDFTGTFQPQQIFAFGGHLPHAFINREGTQLAQSRCIQLFPDPIQKFMAQFPEATILETFLEQSKRGRIVHDDQFHSISRMMDQVFENSGIKRLTHAIELLERLSDPDSSEPLASGGYVSTTASRQVARLESVITYIHENCSSNLNMDQLARISAMSTTAFHRFFKQSLGQTPGAYLNNLRLANSAHQLLETHDSIAEIAFSNGFNNLSNFNRQFKRQFGSNPRSYRSKLTI